MLSTRSVRLLYDLDYKLQAIHNRGALRERRRRQIGTFNGIKKTRFERRRLWKQAIVHKTDNIYFTWNVYTQNYCLTNKYIHTGARKKVQ